MDAAPNTSLADLLSADDLRRLDSIYMTLAAAETDLRGVALAIAGLTAKYHPEDALVRDLLAAHEIVRAAINRTTPCMTALAGEYMRIHAEREARAAAPLEPAAAKTDSATPPVLH